MKKLILSIIICICLFGCKQKESNTSIIKDVAEVAEIVEDVPIIKDSIDILIEQRANTEFSSTIFAGLKFGDTRQTVERVLANAKTREVLVPTGHTVSRVLFDSYQATYYNEQLASITLFSDDDFYIDPLDTLFTTKYGKTKGHIWEFSNCSINISKGNRSLYDPSYDAGYGYSNRTRLFYNNYGGSKTKSLTPDPYFLKLTYSNEDLLGSIQRQKAVRDSLELVERNKKALQEAEQAKKLASEIATNI